MVIGVGESKNGIWRFIKDYKYNSVFFKNFIVVLMVIILPLGSFSILSYYYNCNTARKEIIYSNASILSKIKDIVDLQLSQAEQITLRFAADKDVSAFLQYTPEELNKYISINNINSIENMLNLLMATISSVDSVFIYGDQCDYVVSLSESGALQKISHKEWYDCYQKNKYSKDFWIQNLEYIISDKEKKHTITMFCRSPFFNKDKTGVIVTNIDIKRLEALISIDEKQSDFYIVDKSDRIIYSNNISALGLDIENVDSFIAQALEEGKIEKFRKDKTGIVSIINSDYNDWKYVFSSSVPEYEQKLEGASFIMKVWLLIGMVIAIVLSFIISVQAFRPIKKIIEIVEDYGKDYINNDIRMKVKLDEVKYISSSIVNSYTKNEQMSYELEQRLSLLKQAQTTALQSQINPHFLFNTLETINWEVISLTRSKNTASSMITSLSKLLRMNLETEENLIPLKKELEHANLYFSLQKFRYKDKINIAFDIDDRILQYKIVKLSFQPLIENAIYHGIKPKEGNGTINISGSFYNNDILIVISDDGVGMTQEQVDILRNRLKSTKLMTGRHLGLSNTNQRLKLVFGDAYGVSIASILGKGTDIAITIPSIN